MAAQVLLPDLNELVDALRAQGRTVIGPTPRDEVIVLAELNSAAELPHGWGSLVGPGSYRVARRSDQAAFAHVAGPLSWKTFLHPPRTKLWSIDRDGEPVAAPVEEPRYAFVGVRPCDLRAIHIQDRVLTGGTHRDDGYAARRAAAFIVAVNCTEPGATCFCSSVGTGPAAGPGYDLVLTELDGSYLASSGSEEGARLLAELSSAPVADDAADRADAAVRAAAHAMTRSLPEVGLRELMGSTLDSPVWDEVAQRCLSCGNCTLVCPTCFCTTTEDVTDVTGEHAERWSRWDSCFDLDFSYVHGGSVRSSAKSRYRQWLTHKLGTWHDQFGSSGCVGCGRCIVWCPVGIDLTAEVAALGEGARS